ncbi:MAG: hypothetical protein KIT22_15035, partial [Verrucomicrobiae bacterium]|nr:hypothetical protein [Verrucomicrobiae bacterium]
RRNDEVRMLNGFGVDTEVKMREVRVGGAPTPRLFLQHPIPMEILIAILLALAVVVAVLLGRSHRSPHGGRSCDASDGGGSYSGDLEDSGGHDAGCDCGGDGGGGD